MPLLRVKEIREMTPEERAKKLMDLKAELMRLKTMIKAGGNIENPARIRQLRRAIARILTLEREQRLKLKSKKGGKQK
ncbi:MAG: 50S ribosomal protein L29 [Candidatus Bathyarchaeia archaeon]